MCCKYQLYRDTPLQDFFLHLKSFNRDYFLNAQLCQFGILFILFIELKEIIYSIENVKKYIATKNNKLCKFEQKWSGKAIPSADVNTNSDFAITYIHNM